jgi:hypothetical protein
MSPTQRTHAYLRKNGMLLANCERKLPATPAGYHGPLITVDLFGIIDTIAINPAIEGDMLWIQSTSGNNHNARILKILGAEATPILLRHVRIEVWSWAKRGPRGKRKVWTLRREGFTLRGTGTITTFNSSNDYL